MSMRISVVWKLPYKPVVNIQLSKAKLGVELQLMAKEIQKVDATIKASQYQDLLIQAHKQTSHTRN